MRRGKDLSDWTAETGAYAAKVRLHVRTIFQDKTSGMHEMKSWSGQGAPIVKIQSSTGERFIMNSPGQGRDRGRYRGA